MSLKQSILVFGNETITVEKAGANIFASQKETIKGLRPFLIGIANDLKSLRYKKGPDWESLKILASNHIEQTLVTLLDYDRLPSDLQRDEFNYIIQPWLEESKKEAIGKQLKIDEVDVLWFMINLLADMIADIEIYEQNEDVRKFEEMAENLGDEIDVETELKTINASLNSKMQMFHACLLAFSHSWLFLF